MTSNEFLQTIKPYVIADMKKAPFILASLTTAQAIIESAWGKSGLTQKANNLFGIKGTYNGQSVTMRTREVFNGKTTYVNAAFRKYPTWAESIADHSKFLSTKRYVKLHGLRDYKLACKYIKDAGYATDPNYTKVLINTIEKYKLYEWDNMVGEGNVITPQPTPQKPKVTHDRTQDGSLILETTKDATGATVHIVSDIKRNLKVGDYGEDVGILQKALEKGQWNRHGEYVDLLMVNVFCNNTLAAVKRFQQAKGLTVDGVAGPATIKALNI